MDKGIENEVVAAHLTRVPWWRSALRSLGAGKHRRHEEMPDRRVANRGRSDTVREEDLKAWLAVLEGEPGRGPGDRREP